MMGDSAAVALTFVVNQELGVALTGGRTRLSR